MAFLSDFSERLQHSLVESGSPVSPPGYQLVSVEDNSSNLQVPIVEDIVLRGKEYNK